MVTFLPKLVKFFPNYYKFSKNGMSSGISEGIFLFQRSFKRKIVNIIQFLALVKQKMSKITFALELILAPTRRRLPTSQRPTYSLHPCLFQHKNLQPLVFPQYERIAHFHFSLYSRYGSLKKKRKKIKDFFKYYNINF